MVGPVEVDVGSWARRSLEEEAGEVGGDDPWKSRTSVCVHESV